VGKLRPRQGGGAWAGAGPRPSLLLLIPPARGALGFGASGPAAAHPACARSSGGRREARRRPDPRHAASRRRSAPRLGACGGRGRVEGGVPRTLQGEGWGLGEF